MLLVVAGGGGARYSSVKARDGKISIISPRRKRSDGEQCDWLEQVDLILPWLERLSDSAGPVSPTRGQDTALHY